MHKKFLYGFASFCSWHPGCSGVTAAVDLKIFHLLIFQGNTLGEFPKEKMTGEFVDSWKSSIKNAKFESVSMHNLVAVSHILLAVIASYSANLGL